MAYNYYQSAYPTTWGTSGFQFGAPPPPGFQPQPSWGGLDYYRAHAASPDPSLFHHAWNRLSSNPDVGGVGVHEARYWHRLAYGGFGEIQTMTPPEIGHAAAYEAYRTWIHNSSMYEPLSADRMRQREALVGLAVAEVSQLAHYSGRLSDFYRRRDACEAAAATGSVLFSCFVDGDFADSQYGSHRGLRRSPSFSNYDYPPEIYAFDDDIPRRSRRHRRHSSSSINRPVIQYNASPVIPGATPSYIGGSTYGGTSPYMAGSSPYNPAPINGTPYPVASAYGGGSPYHTQPVMAYQQPVMATPSYTQPMIGGSYGGYPSSQPSTIVIETPSSSSRSSHGHRHSSSKHRKHHRPRTYSDVSYTTLQPPMVSGYRY